MLLGGTTAVASTHYSPWVLTRQPPPPADVTITRIRMIGARPRRRGRCAWKVSGCEHDQACAKNEATAMYTTEGRNASSLDIDLLPPEQAVALFLQAEDAVLPAVRAAVPAIVRLVRGAAARWQVGGRLLYVGAGTSARIAKVDAVSLTTTFGVPSARVRVLAAGGDAALAEAKGNAEDDHDAGGRDVADALVGERDIVVGLTASGKTPYVLGAAKAARSAGALVGAIVSNPSSPLSQEAHVTVEILTGAEVIMGSTRLKAGSAQKVALNAFSTVLMVQLGYTYSNLMVNLLATNEKLKARAGRIVAEATGCDLAAALRSLDDGGGDPKVAILSILTGRGSDECAQALAQCGERLRAAVAFLSNVRA